MRDFLRALTVLGLAAVIGACSTTEEHMKPVNLVKFKPTAELKKNWTRSVESNSKALKARLYVAPMDGKLFLSGVKGGVTALDEATGKKLWRTELNTRLAGATGAAAGKVFVGSLEGELIALGAEEGKELWRAQLSSEIVSPPQANRSTVLAVTIDGRLYAYDVSTGEKKWSYDHPVPVLTYRNQSNILIEGSHAYVAFDNGQLLSFDIADGQLRWAARVSQPQGTTELERAVDLDSMPILDGPYVYSAGANGRVVAVNRATGRIVWGKNISTFDDMTIFDENLVLSSEESHVIAYDSSNGSKVWENEGLHRRGIRAPSTIGNYVAVIDRAGYLHLLSGSDGELAARAKPPGSAFSSPMQPLNDQLLVLSDDGKLTSYKIKEKAVAVASSDEES